VPRGGHGKGRNSLGNFALPLVIADAGTARMEALFMRIKKKNVARLASLSALGAGALGVAAGTAHAGIVYTPLSGKVGFSTGYGAFATVGILSSARFGLYTIRSSQFPGADPTYRFSNKLWGSSLVFKRGDAVRGQTWNKLAGAGVSSMRLGLRQSTRSSRWVPGPGHWTSTLSGQSRIFTYTPGTSTWKTYTQQSHSGTNGYFYKLFQFNGGSLYGGDLYGWAYFLQNVTDTAGPDVDILGVAYDDSGTVIPAGDTGVPEPSTMALTGLAALALGATGLRRWRAARKPAA
jgi:hypothetical protein